LERAFFHSELFFYYSNPFLFQFADKLHFSVLLIKTILSLNQMDVRINKSTAGTIVVLTEELFCN